MFIFYSKKERGSQQQQTHPVCMDGWVLLSFPEQLLVCQRLLITVVVVIAVLALTCKNARIVVESTTLSAEHTQQPASSFCAPLICRVPSRETCKCPYELLGNIRVLQPSFFQNTEGGGLPSATHGKRATPFKPTFLSWGLTINVGGAVTKVQGKKR